MAGWDGNGTFSVTYDFTDQRDAGVKILAAQMDQQFADVTSGLNNCVTLDGQTTATGNLPMGTNRHTGVGNAAARTDYAAAGQIQDGGLTYAAAGGAANAYTATLSPAITAYATGMPFLLKIGSGHTNTSTSCTMTLNGISGAKTVKLVNGNAPLVGDIVAGKMHWFTYDGTDVILLNPAKQAGLSSFTATLIDDASAASFRTTLGLGNLATQNDSGTITLTGVVSLSNDATNMLADGDTKTLNFGRSDTHGDSVNLADIVGYGVDDGAAATAYARLRFICNQDANSSEDGSARLFTMNGGSEQLEMAWDAGIAVGDASAPTGGRGHVNASGYEVGGVSVLRKLASAQATTSGSSFNFGSLPAGTCAIDVIFNGVSLSGTDNLLVQIGDSGGIENTSYVSIGQEIGTSGSALTTATDGFIIRCAAATDTFTGVMSLRHVGSNLWVATYTGTTNSAQGALGSGTKTLSAELTQLTLTRTGSDSFDAGSVTIQYQVAA